MKLYFSVIFLILLYFQLYCCPLSAQAKIQIQQPNNQLLAADSPEELTKTNGRWKQFYNDHLSTAKSATLNLTSTATSFYIVSLLRVLYRMTSEPENDVEMLRNFFTNQVFSSQAQVSLLLSITGIQTANSVFAKLGNRFQWLKDESKIKNIMISLAEENKLLGSPEILTNSKGFSPKLLAAWKAVRASAERQVPGRFSENVFRKLSLMSSFAVALPIITVLSDLLTDPDIVYYSESLISTPDQIQKMINEKGYSPYFAQQRAYARWVTSHKILDYTPVILSAWTALSIQLFVLPKALESTAKIGIEVIKKIPDKVSNILLKGINLSKIAGKLIPQTRLISAVGQGIVFLALNTPILDFSQTIYNEQFYSRQIINNLKNLEVTNLSPTLTNRCKKSISSLPSFDQNKFELLPYSVVKKTLINSELENCDNLPVSFSEQLDLVANDFNHWRQIWFEKSISGLASWSERISRLQNEYHYGYALFRKFIFDSATKNGSAFYEDPFYGIGSADLLRNTNNRTEVLVKIYRTLESQIERLSKKSASQNLSTEESEILRVYKKIFKYFSALNQNKYKPDELVKQYESNKKYEDSALRNEVALQRYVAQGVLLYKKEGLIVQQLFKNSKDHDIAGLHEILMEAEPMKFGESWFKNFILSNHFLKSPKMIFGSLQGINYNNEIEKLFLTSLCSPTDTFELNRIPFWSLNTVFPSPFSNSNTNPCSILKDDPDSYLFSKKSIFLGQFEINNYKYNNLVHWATKHLRPEFQIQDESKLNQQIELFWKNEVDKPLKKQLDLEEKEFFKFFNNTVYPSLFKNESYSGLPLGLVPSLQVEINYYLSVLVKISPQFSTWKDFVEKITHVSILIIKNPMDTTNWKKDLKSLFVNTSDFNTFQDSLLKSNDNHLQNLQTLLLYLTNLSHKNAYELIEPKSMETEQGLATKNLVDLVQSRLMETTGILKFYQMLLMKDVL